MAQATGNGETVAGACVQGRELQPLDADAVKRAVLAVLTRADAELGRGVEGCTDAGFEALQACAREVAALFENLADAVPVLRLLHKVHGAVERRIAALDEVREVRADEPPYRYELGVPGGLPYADELPARWQPPAANDEDIPF